MLLAFKGDKKIKGIGFVSCAYLQEALGRFPREAIIFRKSYFLPFSILFAGQSIKGSIFFQAVLEHLMNSYGGLWAWVIYSQSDSAISKRGPQRLWKVKHHCQGNVQLKNTRWLCTRRQEDWIKTTRLSTTLALPSSWEKGFPIFLLLNIPCRKRNHYFLYFVLHLE